MNRRASVCIGVLLAFLPGAKADQAIVVGIEQYKPLVAASTLKGCVNDATDMANALRKDGFSVTLLLNEKATRSGIYGEIKRLETASSAEQRFVFYYAGHGRKSPRYALMPSDTTASGNDISTKELNDAILRVPARSRTVILDSCFSGGMAAGEMSRGGDDFEPRFFDGQQARSIEFGVPPSPTSKKDTPQQLAGNSGICYYTASLGSEQALEATMEDGKKHGIFTHALLSNLQDGMLWGDVHSGVKKTIGKKLENSGRTQNPMISSQFIGAEVLDNVPKPTVKIAPTKTLLEVWNSDNPNGEKIALKILPDQDVIEAGREVSLEIQVGADGYLVIFGQVGDQFYQFYPTGSAKAADAAVKKGPIRLPQGRDRLFFEGFGADHLKAMLFTSADAAQAVLDAMQRSQGRSKDTALARGIDDTAFTSRLSVAVGDNLVGGLRLKDLNGLYKKVLAQDNDLSRFLVTRMLKAADGYGRGVAWLGNVNAAEEPTLSDKQTFVTLLNLAIQGQVLYDSTTFKKVKLPDRIKKAANKPPTGEKLMELNRAILVALFPEEVNADDARDK
jgi:metacaspase-1